MASIIITTGHQKGNYYPLGQRTNVVGRDEALPIQILDNRISRRHVKIHFNENNWSYSAVDLSSKNGVLINGVKINKETNLADGDYIIIGNTELMYTKKDFFDRESVLAHIKKAGERERPTKTQAN